MPAEPNSFREIIEWWDSRAVLGRRIGVTDEAVRQWHLRDTIPERHWDAIIRFARIDGFARINYATLQKIKRAAKARAQ
jgi:hypothetical protein